MASLRDLSTAFSALSAQAIATSGNIVPPFAPGDSPRLAAAAADSLSAQSHIDTAIGAGRTVPQPDIDDCNKKVEAALDLMKSVSNGTPGANSASFILGKIHTANSRGSGL